MWMVSWRATWGVGKLPLGSRVVVCGVAGYAHTGEEGGGTINEWYPKVRSGGVFAGHDYSDSYPDVIKAVNGWAKSQGFSKKEMHVIGPADPAVEPWAFNDCCAAWFVVKP